ncbi:MAG: fasciclin domain-containing protein [Phormidesmis sp.]
MYNKSTYEESAHDKGASCAASKAAAKGSTIQLAVRALAPSLLASGLLPLGLISLGLLTTLPDAAKAETPSASLQLAQAGASDSLPLPQKPTSLATENYTIAEITSSSSNFSTLAAALDAADLTEVLNSSGPFTLFAPTDEAFAALPLAAIEALMQPENKQSLVELLTYHVIPGALRSTDLASGDMVTVEGSTVAIDVTETVTVNSSQVITADVVASNGIIHVIDRVIIPPSALTGSASTATTTR